MIGSRSFEGEVKEFLEVAEDLTVQGGVTAGAVITADTTLAVQGAVGGPITIQSGGCLNVQGAFNAEVQSNQGTVMVAGAVNIEPWKYSPGGRYAVAIGSVFNTRGAPRRLNADGTFTVLSASERHKISINAGAASDYMVYDVEQDEFFRLDDD